MLHLRYFVAVAEELNFSAAARRLHMATSPLSQRIRDLERELDHRLFERDTHHVALTPAGAALLPIAKDVLDQVSSIPWRVQEASRPARSTVFLGLPTGVHPRLRTKINTLVGRVGRRFELQRWPCSAQTMVTDVRDGKIAVGLARLPVSDSALDQQLVMTERLGALVPADRFAGRDSISLAELADLSFVITPREIRPVYFDKIDSELSANGIKKRISLAGTGYGGVAELISAGMAFYFTMLDPDSPMHGYDLENLSVLPVADFFPCLETGLIWRRDRASGEHLGELIETARQVFSEPLNI
ncbi:LysR family transcriptional regulator [Streptomyces sp. NPDC020742]|uniref:LysR family transcriptional regulator n=1 Tax=unclassified Streptomyces TaxID=2593676 RepID=UPI0033CA4995